VTEFSIGGGRSVHWMDSGETAKKIPFGPVTGLSIEFSEPVPEPIALGYGCHFGLGQFREARK
jgi:hypothetical protein